MKQFIRRLATAVGLMGAVVAMMAGHPAAAQTSAQVRLQPVADHSDTVTVDILANDVTNLYGVEFTLRYDPALLAIEDVDPERDGIQITPGTLLPVEQGFLVINQADQATGTVNFAMTLLNPARPVSGSGPLAQVSFRKLQNAPTTLDIPDIKLVSVDLQVMPANVAPLTLNAGQPAAGSAANFPWWIVALAIIVVGVIALGVIMAMGSSQKAQPVAVPQQPARSRPSAFK